MVAFVTVITVVTWESPVTQTTRSCNGTICLHIWEEHHIRIQPFLILPQEAFIDDSVFSPFSKISKEIITADKSNSVCAVSSSCSSNFSIRGRWCKMGKLRFKRLYKELNKMEYSKKHLFMTFDC
jgi:hypothetical protein